MIDTRRTTEVHQVTEEPVEGEVRQTQAGMSGAVVAQRIIWFVLGVVNALLAIRFVLLLLGANQSAGFVDFIYGITGFLVSPFVGIFGEPTYGRFMFDWSSVLAIVVYSLIAWGIVRLITLNRPQEEVV